MSELNRFDYIVIGAGSSGCIVASRLAQEQSGTVLLLEAGDIADNNPETMSADGFKYAFANDKVMWDRMSEPQAQCEKRRIYMGSGTGMGGSGGVNGMVYTRGDKADFNNWPKGWQWQNIEPAFTAVEAKLTVQSRPATGFTKIALSAAEKVGFKTKHGLLDGDLKGYMGYNAMNFAGDHRRSSYMAFIRDLNPAQATNLSIKTQALVHKIVFDNDDTAIAIEVEIAGVMTKYAINKELILCAGALETPKLLMLSGIGDKDELAQAKVALHKHVPSIGKNLHDHPNVCLFFQGKKPVDFGYPQLYGFDRVNPNSSLAEQQPDTCFTFMAAPITLHQSMHRMIPALALPGKLFYSSSLRKVLRGLIDLAFKIPALESFVNRIYGIVVILGKPESRGSIRLASNNPKAQALINPAFYQNKGDLNTMLLGVQKAKAIAAQQGLKDWGNSPMLAGHNTNKANKLSRWVYQASMTTFHYCGSCSMGDDAAYPVDAKLKLKGFSNVRIADASVIPEIPVSALNAPSMMIGYRAVDFILNSSSNNNNGIAKSA